MFVFCAMNIEQAKNKNKQVEALLNKIAHADMDAVGELYDLIKTDVYAFALSKFLSSSDAEDIMQETFVRVFKYAKQYKPSGKPMAWIITIELNLIRRHFQLASRVTPLDEAIALTQNVSESEVDSVNGIFVQQVLKLLSEDQRLTTSILSVGDGVAISIRKHAEG